MSLLYSTLSGSVSDDKDLQHYLFGLCGPSILLQQTETLYTSASQLQLVKRQYTCDPDKPVDVLYFGRPEKKESYSTVVSPVLTNTALNDVEPFLTAMGFQNEKTVIKRGREFIFMNLLKVHIYTIADGTNKTMSEGDDNIFVQVISQGVLRENLLSTIEEVNNFARYLQPVVELQAITLNHFDPL